MSRPVSISGLPLPSSSASSNPAHAQHGASASSAASSSSSMARQLNLTEELDKLEQSITLTLQEIDHNFNQCHRIVTHSIMPIIDGYTEQSKSVNDGARFWKQFFEFSANVQIGSYESRIEDETATETQDSTYSHDTINTAESSAMVEHPTNSADDSSILPPSVHHDGGGDEHAFGESSADISTPRPSQTRKWANIESPYETLRKELKLDSMSMARGAAATAAEPSARKLHFGGGGPGGFGAGGYADDDDDDDDSPMPKPPEVTMQLRGMGGGGAPTTAMKGMRLDDTFDDDDESSMPTTPDSIRHPPGSHRPRGRMLATTPETAKKVPDHRQAAEATATAKRSTKNDVLLHRAVDTNWRLQATPLVRPTTATTPKRNAKAAAAAMFDDDDDDDSPISSPAPPQITTVLPAFDTPPGGGKRWKAGAGVGGGRPGAAAGGPKTPTSKKKMLPPGLNFDFDDDDDDDDDDDLGFSPPVTMQFTLPPSKLLQTPAREASRRLVRDIMQSAGLQPPASRGMGFRDDDDDYDDDTTTTTTDTTRDSTLDSPTMLRAGEPTDGFADF